MKKFIFLIATTISLIFLIIGVAVLSDYGQNWDESTHFFRGQAFLNFFLTGNKKYENLPDFKLYHQKDDTVLFAPEGQDKKTIYRVSMYQYKRLAFDYWKNASPGGHPPLSDIFASFFNFVLFQKLGFINDVDSYHVYSIFLASILVGTIFIWVSRNYGIFAGLISGVSLALYPIFYGESHFNIKDVPEAVFFSMSIIFFYEGIVKKKNIWIILSSISFSFAFATKFNALFIPFIILPWVIFYLLKSKNWKKYFSLIPSLVAYPVIIIAVFFASWPFLWQSPVNRFMEVVNYYREIGNNAGFDSRYITVFGLNTYPLQWVLYITPLVVLFLSLIGIIYVLKFGFKEKTKISLLILIWFLLPILRIVRPGSGIYGGVRHIMEYVPAMAILAGIGAFWLRHLIIDFVKNRINKNINEKILNLFLSLLIIFSFTPLVLKLISLHPNEGLYFNSLIGGFKGAKEGKLLDAGMELGNVYKQGIKWININAEKNAKLVLFSGLGSDLPGVQTRGDINFSNNYRTGLDRKGEYAFGLVENFDSYSDNFMYDYYTKFLIPVYEIKVEGIPILIIWKNDLPHTNKMYLGDELINGFESKLLEQSLLIDLKTEVQLEKIRFTFNNDNCSKSFDGSIEVSSNMVDWLIIDNDLSVAGMSAVNYNFRASKDYIYPFAALKTRYLKFNFTTPNSCFNYIDKTEIHKIK